ncbi:cytochrome P450 [Xylaria cubensis]|nr:cytochrome P450 [Xylaria cubensis]
MTVTDNLWHLLNLALLFSTEGYLFPCLVLTTVLLIGAISKSKRKNDGLSHIPVLGPELSAKGRTNEFRYNAKAFLQRGYEEFNKNGEAFLIQTTEGPMVVLNSQQSSEVGSMPDHIVDNMRPNGRALMDSYTGYLDGDAVVFRILKTQLTTQLGDLGDILAAQTDRCLISEFQDCEDWAPVQILGRLTRIVAAVSTRVFVGEELTTDEEWLKTTIDYTVQLVTCATILKHIPSVLRPVVYRFIPAYRKLQGYNNAAIRMIKPIVQARREAMEDAEFGGGNDMLQWMLNERVKRKFHDKDYVYLAQLQLQLSFAATHTTSMAVTNMLYDLVAWPEYIDVLRAEVMEQLAANRNSFRGNFVRNLHKMDSFMKESQRHNPVGYTIMGRDTCQDVTLSDGLFLPKGTFVVANLYQITHDPDIVQSDSDPNSFDGLRYYKMRNKLLKIGVGEKEVAGKHQFVSVSNSSMMFGYGKHACPGRFFASNEIKIILAKLLVAFDFETPAGVTGRYESKSWEMSNYPDPDKKIMMKRRIVV